MSPVLRARVVVVLLTLLPVAAPASSVAMASSRDAAQVTRLTSPVLTVGRSAWVAVAVARLWESPSAPWPVDAPALRSPVRFRAWLRHMTIDERKALDTRSDTEALLGDRVVVVRLRPHWVKVVVPSQPSQKDSRGYPGWIPRGQLTARTPMRTGQVATVVTRTAWLRTDDADHVRGAELSFGTAMSVLGQVGLFVRVVTPQGAVRRLYASTVAVHAADAAAIQPSRASLKQTAKSFLGLPYLWGGLSGFGIDCSGLTWLDYRAHGIRIPRDALPQSRSGRRTTTREPGDLVFYARSGLVHHVSMYLGDGRVIHAPRTGQTVRIISFSAPPLRAEYAGTRGYLP
jgi:cell wall-associated NlpC family hydrolase